MGSGAGVGGGAGSGSGVWNGIGVGGCAATALIFLYQSELLISDQAVRPSWSKCDTSDSRAAAGIHSHMGCPMLVDRTFAAAGSPIARSMAYLSTISTQVSTRGLVSGRGAW